MRFKPLSPKGIKTYSLKERKSKVGVESLAKVEGCGGSFRDFLEGLPDVLAVRSLRETARAVADAHRAGKPVVIAMGAHVIKVGLSPMVIDLMRRGVVSAVAMNGACIVHDFEIAYAGCTSEDVDRELQSGNFGMAEETGRILNNAIKRGSRKGIGRSIGELIAGSRYPYKDKSILSAGVLYDVPVTVHVALGTDILHIHPQMSGQKTGEASMRDFRIFCSVISSLEGGVYMNIGSAVVLPEVFLKALTLVRNLGYRVRNFTTVNMDFIQHYRPLTNVIRRPTKEGGRGISLTGHHEIMLPLLYWAIIEELKGER